MFTVFKPKGGRVKAVKVTLENVAELAKLFQGRVFGKDGADNASPRIDGFEYPTFDGIKKAALGDYVIDKDNGYDITQGKEFEDTYEPARVMTRDNKS